jgi:hypothetical protein
LGDFDEIPEIEMEIDDLKMKFKIHKPLKKKQDPEPSLLKEFDENTSEITVVSVDLKTDKILRDNFQNICPGFLENRCSLEECKRSHELSDYTTVRASLRSTTKKEAAEVLDVALRFHRLFQDYVVVFAEKFINDSDTPSLIKLVKGCDRHVRTRQCLRDIVRKIIDMDHWKVHRAIRFIIEHHIDSSIARDTILHMILDSGPCMPYFMDYIEFIYAKQTIGVEDFNRILHGCVAYQNPRLPNFCLNYLNQCAPDRLVSLHKENLRAFLSMHRCFSELNETREAKLLAVVDKVNRI